MLASLALKEVEIRESLAQGQLWLPGKLELSLGKLTQFCFVLFFFLKDLCTLPKLSKKIILQV